MKDHLLICITLLFILILTGCATVKPATMKDIYPGMYSVKPVSILILPPKNQSTASEAKEYFSCSLAEPLAQKGYYPLPVEAMYSIMKQEGLYDTEVMTPEILANLNKYFGADAVLITTIETWEKGFGKLTIDAKYEILNTKTSESMWDFKSKIIVNLQSNSSNNALANLIVTAVKTAVEDYFPHAYESNKATFNGYLPSGKYRADAGKDGELTVPASKSATIRVSK
jgi:hypothetical protein